MNCRTFLICAALFAVFSCPIVSNARCTGGMALGFPANDQNIIGATLDWGSPLDLSMLKAKLVTDGKYRYIRVAFGGQPGDGAWLNEKGVGYKDFSRLIKMELAADPEIDQNIVSDQLMKTSDSAKAFVEAWTPILAESGCGQPRNAYSGWALLIIDNSNGYLVEAGDVIENNTVKHPYAVYGPMKDTVFAQANYYLDKNLRNYQFVFPGYEVGGAGYERARRMWNMLAQKQYFKVTSDIASGTIGVSYYMDVLRSRGVEEVNSRDELKQMWYQKPLDDAGRSQGVDAISKNMGASGESIGLTYCGQIIKPSKEYPDLLSCIWSGLGFPLTSPFLPFYIGVNELPASVTNGEKQGDFAFIFNQLYNLVFSEKQVKGKPVLVPNASRLKVMVATWRSFDTDTYAQSIDVESGAAALAAEGKDTEAKQLLTDFLKSRTDEAISTAEAWIAKWSK